MKQLPNEVDSPSWIEDLNIESILNNKDKLLSVLEKDLEFYEQRYRKMTEKISTLNNRISNIFDYAEWRSLMLDSSLDSSIVTESSLSNDSSFISISTDPKSILDSSSEIN